MSDGVIVIAGVFEPGSVVSLVPRPDENHLRAGDFPIDKRVADENGDVGFAGLDVGDLFFVCGYKTDGYYEMRVQAHAPDDVQHGLAQPSDGKPEPLKVGIHSVPASDPPPAQPAAGHEVGVPPLRVGDPVA